MPDAVEAHHCYLADSMYRYFCGSCYSYLFSSCRTSAKEAKLDSLRGFKLLYRVEYVLVRNIHFMLRMRHVCDCFSGHNLDNTDSVSRIEQSNP